MMMNIKDIKVKKQSKLFEIKTLIKTNQMFLILGKHGHDKHYSHHDEYGKKGGKKGGHEKGYESKKGGH